MAIGLQSTMLGGKMVHFNGKKYSFGRESEISCHATHHKTSVVAMHDRNKYNFYEVLSLDFSKNVGLDEIKKAYRSKALRFHPDICLPSTKEESTRRFLEIKTAYETLSDPISREIYDDELLSLVDGKLGMIMSCRVDKRRSGGNHGFSREVWLRQISGLKKRSTERLGKKIFQNT